MSKALAEMTTEERASNLHKRIDAHASETTRRFDAVQQSINSLGIKLEQSTTVMRRHVTAQEQFNEHMRKGLEAQDERLRKIEQKQAIDEQTRPSRHVDADQVEHDIDQLQASVAGINRTLAKWAGIAAGAIVAVNVVAEPVLKWAWTALTGG